MPAFSASAPGKVILFGEHAVVYGRPAIAVPVLQVRAKALVSVDPRSFPGLVKFQAPDIGLESTLYDLPENHPLAAVVLKAGKAMQLKHIPACTIKVTSTIPIAGGMGSGAAVSVAILRAFSASLGHPLSNEQVSQLAYEVEVIQDARWVKRTRTSKRTREYLVKWTGYAEPAWEKVSQLNCGALLYEFERRHRTRAHFEAMQATDGRPDDEIE